MACLSSFKSYLQGTPSYQTLSSAPKPIRSYAIKPKRICEFLKKIQAPSTIPTHFHSFKSITNIHPTFLFATIYQD
jgi:hypothetical protein